MYTKTACHECLARPWRRRVACTLFAGSVAAQDHEVTVAIQVSTQGLDLSQPAGAHEFYTRLQHAAWVVCTHGNRVDLEPSANPRRCYEKALGDAIRSANVPLLTQVYLGNAYASGSGGARDRRCLCR